MPTRTQQVILAYRADRTVATEVRSRPCALSGGMRLPQANRLALVSSMGICPVAPNLPQFTHPVPCHALFRHRQPAQDDPPVVLGKLPEAFATTAGERLGLKPGRLLRFSIKQVRPWWPTHVMALPAHASTVPWVRRIYSPARGTPAPGSISSPLFSSPAMLYCAHLLFCTRSSWISNAFPTGWHHLSRGPALRRRPAL